MVVVLVALLYVCMSCMHMLYAYVCMYVCMYDVCMYVMYVYTCMYVCCVYTRYTYVSKVCTAMVCIAQ